MAACAPELVMQPAELSVPSPGGQRRTIAATAIGVSSAGYTRSLLPGAQFERVGRIREGEVWRPLNLTLTAEGASIHEAYVVVTDGRWVGFYLPVERAFSPLKTAVPLTVGAE